MSIVIVGSFVVDCIATCFRAPEAGETLIGNSFNTYLGGKGANQAFAAKRMGSEVFMAGALGNDSFKGEFIEAMQKEGMPTNLIKEYDTSTGVSSVLVDSTGQNRICMVPGANMCYNSDNLKEIIKYIEKSNVVVTQFEMQEEVAYELIRICRRLNKRLILNPAPAHKIPNELLKDLYCITPNETELGILIDEKLATIDDYKRGARKLLALGVKNVIVTLGTMGSLLVNEDGEVLIPAFRVKAIDTLGAGDSYTGSLASMLDQNKSLREAIEIATAVAALEVQRPGGIPAMPYKEEVLSFLAKEGKSYSL